VNASPVFDNISIYLLFHFIFSSYLSGICSEKPENISTSLQSLNILVAFMDLKLKPLRNQINPITNRFKTLCKHVGRNLIEVRSFVYYIHTVRNMATKTGPPIQLEHEMLTRGFVDCGKKGRSWNYDRSLGRLEPKMFFIQ